MIDFELIQYLGTVLFPRYSIKPKYRVESANESNNKCLIAQGVKATVSQIYEDELKDNHNHRPKFLHVNPTISCSAFKDLPGSMSKAP